MSEHEERIPALINFYSNGNSRVKKLLAISVGRIWIKMAASDPHWETRFDHNAISHIRDWIWASVKENEPWLQNKDEKGRPKKLMKFGSMEQIIKEADKAMMIANQKMGQVTLEQGEEKLVYALDDGYSIIRMLTAASLDRESSQMQHCIGQGAYDDKLDNSRYQYLSLRDRFGKPHVTFEIIDGVVDQMQGKQNAFPETRYVDVLTPWILQSDFDWSQKAGKVRPIKDAQGTWYDITALPNGFHYPRHLTITHSGVKSLPENMRVDGNLTLLDLSSVMFPRSIQVQSCIALLNIKDDILLPKFNNPELLVTAEHCGRIELEEGYEGSTLDVWKSGSVSLPDTAKLDTLRLMQTPLTGGKLPDNFVCKRIELQSTGIKKIPNKIESCAILSMVDEENVLVDPNHIEYRNSITIDNCGLSHLPAKVTTEYFKLYGCTLEKSGEEAVITGTAHFTKTNFPNEIVRIECNGDFSASETNSDLPKYIRADSVDIRMSYSSNIPEEIYAKSFVAIQDTNFYSLPTSFSAQALMMNADQEVDISDHLHKDFVVQVSNPISGMVKMTPEEYHARYMQRIDECYGKIPEDNDEKFEPGDDLDDDDDHHYSPRY